MSSVAYLNHWRRTLLRSFESGGEAEQRASSRNLRAAVTGAASAIARCVQVGAWLVTIPIAIRYLGNERFGLWMTINSVLAMASFADFGIGYGVLNQVAKASGRDDMDGVRRAVSSGFAVLGCISIVLLGVVFATFRFIPWADFFRVSSLQARAEAGPALIVFATCFALNIPLDIVQRVQLGLQQGYRYSLWQLVGSALGLVGVVGGVWMHAGLPALVAAVAGAPLFATALNAVHFFGFVRPDLRPSAAWVARAAIAGIAGTGGMFFVMQVVGAIAFSSDSLVLARVLGPLAVAQYAVPSKLFSLTSMATSFFLAPLWPAYAEALERRDHLWIRRTLSRSLILATGLSIFLSGFLIAFANKIIHLWVGVGIHASPLLLAGLGIWAVLMPVSSAIYTFLNGLSLLRFQVTIALLTAPANLAISIYLTRRIGIPGVVYGSVLSQSVIVLAPCCWYLRRYFTKELDKPAVRLEALGLP